MGRTEVLQGIRLMKFEEIYGRTRCRALSQADAASVHLAVFDVDGTRKENDEKQAA